MKHGFAISYSESNIFQENKEKKPPLWNTQAFVNSFEKDAHHNYPATPLSVSKLLTVNSKSLYEMSPSDKKPGGALRDHFPHSHPKAIIAK